MYEWIWYICMYIYIYINSILIDDGDTKGSPKNALILCHRAYMYVCHFIISSPLFTEEDVGTRNKRNEEQTICIYMYVCLWPIGIVYMHVAHTNTNGISLCCRPSRPTKKKRTRKRRRESTSFFVYRQTPVETKKGDRERKKKISARYTPLYAPVLSIDVGIRCCYCCRLCWQR